jgi:hypothetical protein
MQTRRVTIGLLVAMGVLVGRVTVRGDEAATASVSGLRTEDQGPCVVLGGLHLPRGALIWTNVMVGQRLSLMLDPGDYLVMQPADQQDAVWLLLAGTIRDGDSKEGPKVFLWQSIYAELHPADGTTDPKLHESTDGFRNADYHRPDGLIVRLKIAAR